MRLLKRGRADVICRGEKISCALRPVSGRLTAALYGEYVQDVLRLLLPWKIRIQPGEKLEVEGKPYICIAVRCYPGHFQADVRRCSR